jgi:DNA repair protein RadC
MKRVGRSSKDTIDCPEDVVKVVGKHLGMLPHEEFIVTMLDSKASVLGHFILTTGSGNSCAISMQGVIKAVLLSNAISVVLSHNHPSGDPEPSLEDIDLTKKIQKVCALLEVEVLDHVIIGHNRFVSLKQRGFI